MQGGMNGRFILAGDIGGTHARLATFQWIDGKLELVRQGSFHTQDYVSLKSILALFLDDEQERIGAACLGIAGPVIQGRVIAPNLHWNVNTGTLKEILKTDSIWLLNDLEAAGYGIDLLEEQDFLELNRGVPIEGNRVLLSAGTGLGEGLLVWTGKEHFVSKSEGGHADFAPQNQLEFELYEFLAAEFQHVSWERVLSGPGILNLYRFFCAKENAILPDWLSERIAREDPSAAVLNGAIHGKDPICVKTLEAFIRFLGREAGNLALKAFATGGVYLGGGIAPSILEQLKSPLFLDEFVFKGRLSSLLGKIPVRVILRSDVGLLGAARYVSEREKMKWAA